jgi:cytochrome c oxidase assembly protein subunit 11
MTTADLHLRNRQLMGKLLVIAVGMLGFGFAMVPMYRQICEAIGITQTRAVGSVNTQVDTSREVKVRCWRILRACRGASRRSTRP